MQLPVDLQETAAAAPEAGSYGYGSTKESGYGYSSSITSSLGAADAAAGSSGWRRMLLQQADVALVSLLQPGSYRESSSLNRYGTYGGSPAALAEAAAAGSYGTAIADSNQELGYGSMRKLLQVDDTTGSYGNAEAAPAGSYGDAADVLAEGLYGDMRRLLQDSTGAAGGYGSMRRLLQDGARPAGSYGGMRRLLQDSTGAAGSYGGVAAQMESGRSNSHVVLVVDVPDAFNPDDNTLALSFSGAWRLTASSSFSAAFRLELLDASDTELLTYDSPTLHHRTFIRPQQQQQPKPILLNYTTLFNDVQLVAGEQAVLRLSTQDSSFNGFQASIHLFWQQRGAADTPPVIEYATPGAYGESASRGGYGASTADAAAAVAAPLAAAAAADATDSTLPEAPEILSREQLPFDPPAAVSTTTSSSSSSDDTLAPAPIMDPTDPAAPLNIREGPVGDPPAAAAPQRGWAKPSSRGTLPAGLTAAAPQRGWAKPNFKGPHMPDEAATAATAPVVDWQPQQPGAQTLQPAPDMPPVGLAEGQLLQPMVVAAVPLPSDAFTGSPSDTTTDGAGVTTTAADFGCRKTVPRGLQCGGMAGHCAAAPGAAGGEGSACRDGPFLGACCASGTMCVRKSEALWVCAPGHGFVRRMLS
ncbi:hypothetical protein COO60DRAFT_1691381 [Scenedesmus sp. NREL 46B-D3]|nr:hypothetical protein COO60DRAFT_1691381 [Scenedesmus sp. NREL 46B-D3]